MSAYYKAGAHPIFGFLAEYKDSGDLLEGIQRARGQGYRKMEAYTPVPDHEILHALEYKNRLPLIVLIGGIVGALVGFGMQWYLSTVEYPINVGGRPMNSWPAFIVVTFETTILFAAGSAVLGMLALNGLPQPYHPVFGVEGFEQASRNRFFLLLMSRDEQFAMDDTRRLLEETPSIVVREVPY